jgi:hypothetical protein
VDEFSFYRCEKRRSAGEFVDLDVDAVIAELSDEERAAMDAEADRMRTEDLVYEQRLADLRKAASLIQQDSNST